MKLKSLFWAALAAVAMSSCGGGSSFTVKGEVEGLGSEEVEMYYPGAGGAIQHVTARADADGSFTLRGDAPDTVLIEIFRSSGAPLAQAVTTNGQTVKLSMKLDDPRSIEMRGNDAVEAMSAFLRACAGSPRLNDSVAAFVGRNADNCASMALLLTAFDAEREPERADSLFNLIGPKGRPLSLSVAYKRQLGGAVGWRSDIMLRPISMVGERDSLMSFVATVKPYSLLVLTDGRRNAAVSSFLRALRRDYAPSRLDIVEVCVGLDSAGWRRSIAADSASWRRGWIPGGPGATQLKQLSVPGLPFFIVTDSTSRQRERSSQPARIREYLKKSVR